MMHGFQWLCQFALFSRITQEALLDFSVKRIILISLYITISKEQIRNTLNFVFGFVALQAFPCWENRARGKTGHKAKQGASSEALILSI